MRISREMNKSVVREIKKKKTLGLSDKTLNCSQNILYLIIINLDNTKKASFIHSFKYAIAFASY